MSEQAWWTDEQETGPPTESDWLWYVEHVALAQDRPPVVNRQPEPLSGQQVILCGAVLMTYSWEAMKELPSGVACDRPAGHSGDHRCTFGDRVGEP